MKKGTRRSAAAQPAHSASAPLIATGRIMTHRLGDFLFDGQALALEAGMPQPQPRSRPADLDAKAMLQPVTMFQGRDDLLSNAILLHKSVASLSQSTATNSGTLSTTAYSRWQNEDASSKIAPPAQTKGYVLVEESRMEELTLFESTLERERQHIADATQGQESTITLFDHNRIEPRNPTQEVRRAMNALSTARLKFLNQEWDKLQNNWKGHAAQFGYDTPYVYREYANATAQDVSKELRNPKESWLLRAAPPHVQEKKMKMIKKASESFRLRQDRDTMLFEDDRSFLVQQMFEAKTRSLDYERYCTLALLFGPMPLHEWQNARSRPGLQYYVRATRNATLIQRCWNVYWSTYKLRRYRAARRVQTKFRAWYGYKMIHPLVILRLKFGKRTYYFFCWARWREYNAMVKAIQIRLEFARTRWIRLCYSKWKGFANNRGAKKRDILQKFRQKFDIRSFVLYRMKMFRDKSKRIKRWLRTTWNIPQFIMWKEFVAGNKRLRALSRVIVPVQAFLRMRQRRILYLKMMRVRPILLKFSFMLACKTLTQRAREAAVKEKFKTWGPEETNRRLREKAENERRRFLREQQVAEEKASVALVELKRHLRSGNGVTQLIILTAEYHQRHHASRKKACVAAEAELLSRCFSCHLDLQVFEYRSSHPPFIVCADPTCKMTFASAEDYLKHTALMSKDEEPAAEEIKMVRRGSAMLLKSVSMKRAEQAAATASGKSKKAQPQPKNDANTSSSQRISPGLSRTNSTLSNGSSKSLKVAIKSSSSIKSSKSGKANSPMGPGSPSVKSNASPPGSPRGSPVSTADGSVQGSPARSPQSSPNGSPGGGTLGREGAAFTFGLYSPISSTNVNASANTDDPEALMQALNVREHSGLDFAEFHVLLKHAVGLEGCRNFLARKLGIGTMLNTLDAWSEIQVWRTGSVASEGFVKRALVIYESYVRPGGARPVMIDLDDGDLRDDFDEPAGFASSLLPWFEQLQQKLEKVKNREYEGYYQAKRHRFFWQQLLGLRGTKVQVWTDEFVLTSDVFDGFEWACFVSLYNFLWAEQQEGHGAASEEAHRNHFRQSREKAKYDDVVNELRQRQHASLYEDCRATRQKEFLAWCADFKADEMVISEHAGIIADAILEAEVNRLVDRASSVWCRETVFRIRHDEQSVHEEKQAVCDEATDWAADDLASHVFAFYAPRLLNTMLSNESMVEGMMEYAGMLRNKKLKKRLDITTGPAGVREDLQWFWDSLAASVEEDMRDAPLDFMGSVRLIQRRIRGVLGRNKARAEFVLCYAKKFDPQNAMYYYVNQYTGDLAWHRPAFFSFLYPKVNW